MKRVWRPLFSIAASVMSSRLFVHSFFSTYIVNHNLIPTPFVRILLHMGNGTNLPYLHTRVLTYWGITKVMSYDIIFSSILSLALDFYFLIWWKIRSIRYINHSWSLWNIYLIGFILLYQRLLISLQYICKYRLWYCFFILKKNILLFTIGMELLIFYYLL